MKKNPTKTRTINEVMADLTRDTKLAAKTLGDFPEGNRAGHESSKRQAQERLPQLREELTDLVVPHRLVGAFISAPPEVRLEIGKLVQDGGVVIAADQFLGKILMDVEKSMGKDRVFGVAQYSLMNHAVRSTAIELNIFSWEAPPFKRVVCKTPADTRDLLVDTLMKYLGPNFELMYFKKKIVDKIAADLNDAPMIPVVIFGQGSHQTYLNQLFTRTRSHVLDDSFKVNETNVQGLFKKESVAKPKTKKETEPTTLNQTDPDEKETNHE